jgi:hypothetical protein
MIVNYIWLFSSLQTILKQVFNAGFAWATSMENVLCPEAQTPSRPYCFTPKDGRCQYVWSRVGEVLVIQFPKSRNRGQLFFTHTNSIR